MTKQQREMIDTCINCELKRCRPNSMKCPYNMKYGETRKALVLRQQKCGFREPSTVMNW